jgi:hypothetical protein
MVAYGDDGNGGSYSIEYGPAGGGLNRIYGPGKYDYHHYPNLKPNDLGYDGGHCLKTSRDTDGGLNSVASGLGSNNNPPNYCVSGNNCWTIGPTMTTAANNFGQYGTSYAPSTTSVNLPPSITITSK